MVKSSTIFSSRHLRRTLSRTSCVLKRTMMAGGARCHDCVEEDADADDGGTDSALLSDLVGKI